jgi:hypothetical protein
MEGPDEGQVEASAYWLLPATIIFLLSVSPKESLPYNGMDGPLIVREVGKESRWMN